MEMPKKACTIYITNEDPAYDYTPALDFGSRLVGIFPPGQIHLSPQVALYRALSVLSDMQPYDYLALSGDPVKIAVCAVVAAAKVGKVNFLRWNRHNKSYVEVRVDFAHKPQHPEA